MLYNYNLDQKIKIELYLSRQCSNKNFNIYFSTVYPDEVKCNTKYHTMLKENYYKLKKNTDNLTYREILDAAVIQQTLRYRKVAIVGINIKVQIGSQGTVGRLINSVCKDASCSLKKLLDSHFNCDNNDIIYRDASKICPTKI